MELLDDELDETELELAKLEVELLDDELDEAELELAELEVTLELLALLDALDVLEELELTEALLLDELFTMGGDELPPPPHAEIALHSKITRTFL